MADLSPLLNVGKTVQEVASPANEARAKEIADALMARLGVGKKVTEAAMEGPGARETAEALAKARVESIAKMTKSEPDAIPEPESTRWRDMTRPGRAVPVASPEGARGS